MPRIARLAMLVLLLCLVPTGQVSAHARLDTASPAPDATIDTPPSEIRIWMTQELMLSGNALAVWDTDGNQVDNGDAHVDQTDPDRRQLVVTLPPLPDGAYRVTYATTSADDGHTFEDAYQFTLAAGVAPAADTAGAIATNGGCK